MLNKNRLPDVFYVRLENADALKHLIKVSAGALSFSCLKKSAEEYEYPDYMQFRGWAYFNWDMDGEVVDYADLVNVFTIPDFTNPK